MATPQAAANLTTQTAQAAVQPEPVQKVTVFLLISYHFRWFNHEFLFAICPSSNVSKLFLLISFFYPHSQLIPTSPFLKILFTYFYFFLAFTIFCCYMHFYLYPPSPNCSVF